MHGKFSFYLLHLPSRGNNINIWIYAHGLIQKLYVVLQPCYVILNLTKQYRDKKEGNVTSKNPWHRKQRFGFVVYSLKRDFKIYFRSNLQELNRLKQKRRKE